MTISIIDTINMSYTFEYHVEEYLQCSKTFEWFVGEGPLYWYKIEWKDPLCPPLECIPSISKCSIEPTQCLCIEAPPCEVPQGQNPCVCKQCQVWHVLATSVPHLCARLNTECCQRPPKGKVFKSVQKYDRPALCCDVDKFIQEGKTMTDEYIDVEFCECECVSWVDPCDCDDIKVPCDHDVPSKPCTASTSGGSSTLSTIQLFGLPRMPIMTATGFQQETIEIMKPQVDSVVTSCNCTIPSTLKLKHNLNQANLLKEFLNHYKLKLDDLDLTYSKHSDSWQKTTHLKGGDEKWRVLTEWGCVKDGKDYSWRLHIQVTKEERGKQLKSKVILNLEPSAEKKRSIDMRFTLNTKSQAVLSKQSIELRSKVIQDEIGLFRGSWGNELKIAVDGK